MKILVMSDSHGKYKNMIDCVRLIQPDEIFFLGDGWNDIAQVEKAFPDIPVEKVPGNCDFTVGEKNTKLVIRNGKKILLTHGHEYSVKMGLYHYEMKAREVGADIALFGHTHCLFYDFQKDLTMLNPGSIGNPPFGNLPSYGIIEMEDNGNYIVETGRLEENDVPFL